MDTPSYTGALYDCATECALRRQSRCCKVRFGDVECDSCPFNVKGYIDADPRQLTLFMMQAENRAANLTWHANRLYRFLIGFAIAVAIFFGVIWNGGRLRDIRNRERESVVQPSKLPHDTPYVAPVGSEAIVNALHKVTRAMNDNLDVNGDGLSNCIDAAVVFYKWFPDKSKVIIIRNYNTTTGMNHLFNAVQIDGVWRAIEPQAFYAGKSSYYMKDVWGAQYDSSCNTDSTDRYKVYAK